MSPETLVFEKQKLIHSLSKCFFNVYHVPETAVGTMDTIKNKALGEVMFSWRDGK